MADCVICANKAFRTISMHDRQQLAALARKFIEGILTGASNASSESIVEVARSVPRRGTCVVERCARFVESACGGCRIPTCQRCSIATELRDAEVRINAERDEELARLAVEEHNVDVESVIGCFVDSLCQDHIQFGGVLVEEWYGQRSLSTSSTVRALGS